jgi:osmotically-inducible protein OsmY
MRVVSVILVFSLLALIAAPLAAAGKVSDDKIYDDVKLKLGLDTQVKGGGFIIDVKDGVVTLQGKVRAEKMKVRAENLTKKVKGVVKVVNKLVVEP